MQTIVEVVILVYLFTIVYGVGNRLTYNHIRRRYIQKFSRRCHCYYDESCYHCDRHKRNADIRSFLWILYVPIMGVSFLFKPHRILFKNIDASARLFLKEDDK